MDRSGRARMTGRLSVAMSDTAVARLGNALHVVGGYTTTVPLRSVVASRAGRAVRVVAKLPYPLR